MKKNYIFLIFLTFFCFLSVNCGFSSGRCGPIHDYSFGFFDRMMSLFSKRYQCYTSCPQSVARHGALALESIWRQNPGLSDAQFFAEIKARTGEEKKHAESALWCIKSCEVRTTPKFLARFWGTLRTPQLVRVIGRLMGYMSTEGADLGSGPPSKGKGVKTNLDHVVFAPSFRKKAAYTLRHMAAEKKQFLKNLGILKTVYYEMYGIQAEIDRHK